ncbi:hypothetical protein SAMN05216222_4884 [Pseudomonas prosekii]|uniref:Uncharacterized protein n=1 Tax=Pseudomonas prosekii TaxID=1148509 RepID=A0A1H2B3A4_9PSED|nr:hypothetical protein SAMN05216222_4884 [Pseudomonas prosekii]
MKLILKRVEREGGMPGPFALHTEDGQILPCQVSTVMDSKGARPPTLVVTFTVDGDQVKVQGDA